MLHGLGDVHCVSYNVLLTDGDTFSSPASGPVQETEIGFQYRILYRSQELVELLYGPDFHFLLLVSRHSVCLKHESGVLTAVNGRIEGENRPDVLQTSIHCSCRYALVFEV